jgi:hypothetical protein
MLVVSFQWPVVSGKDQGFRAVWHSWADYAPGGLNYAQMTEIRFQRSEIGDEGTEGLGTEGLRD